MADRFQKAARDGYLKTLQQATKRDCNSPDEAGMTPTACAAFEGNLEALRLIVSRGGDPDKCDNFGNTSLHCSAVKGHMPCVTFLVNFGANLHALDNQYHSPKDLAAIADRQEVLRFLDSAAAKQQSKDPAMVKKLKEKADKDVEKRLDKTEKLQKKMDKQRECEQKQLDKERELLEKVDKGEAEPRRKSFISTISRGSLAFINKPRRDSKLLYANTIPAANYSNSPTFSDLTTSANAKKTASSIQKKIFNRKVLQDVQNNKNARNNEFKVREGEGGNTVRHLTGLRRDSEIILVPDASLSATAGSPGAKHAKLSEVFDSGSSNRGGAYFTSGNMGNRTLSVPDFGNVVALQPKGSIFDRPGFGSVAFRNTITGTFGGLGGGMSGIAGLGEEDEEDSADEASRPQKIMGRDGMGSAGSLRQDSSSPFEEEDLPSDDEVSDTPLFLFLAGLGLTAYIATFTDNHVDMEALMLLTEEDLKELGLPLGPRRKLLNNTQERTKNIVRDSNPIKSNSTQENIEDDVSLENTSL